MAGEEVRLTMQEDENREPRWLNDHLWQVMPRWVRLYTAFVGMPAWLGVMYGIVSGHAGDDYPYPILIALFASAALPGIVFQFRAYWRMDL